MTAGTAIPYSVGLAGDGDEIAAIEDVERAFGVTLDTTDAPHWRTAGDVFRSLRVAGGTDADWTRFAGVLAGQSGIDPELLTPESPLLLPPSNLWRRATEASAIVFLGLSLLLATIVALAILR